MQYLRNSDFAKRTELPTGPQLLPVVPPGYYGKTLSLYAGPGGALSWIEASSASLPTPEAPTAGQLDGSYRLFYFALNPDYPQLRHEYTTDGGATWQVRKNSNPFLFLPVTAVASQQYGIRVAAGSANQVGNVCWAPPLAAGGFTAANAANANGHAAYDGAENGNVGGWCFDENNRQATVALDVIIDGTLWRPMPANIQRADVAAAFPGVQGYAGFSFQLPSAFRDGGQHTVNVRLRTTGQDIGSKLVTLNPL